jgi:D-alanyl-D-alanine carboxypeptidase/D-alanyl-D-alanine-endopeptidase (penicillin-binding protein 4)
MFTGPQWLQSVDPAERTSGYLGLVSALEIDGDRNDPTKETSPRSATPELRAGTWLKQALGASATGATVVAGKLPTNATAIATVQSQPISNWINHMLAVSDNTQAEYLARLVSLAQNLDGSFTSIDASTKKALASLGLDASGSVILDGSGESPENAVSPAFMVKLVKQIFLASGNLAIVKQSLPVSGESGSLQNRFKGDNIDAVGKVFAKTGWILHGYTLAGYITAKDGSNLVFAIYALGPKVENSAKDAIDALATSIYRCGAALGNSSPTPSPTN